MRKNIKILIILWLGFLAGTILSSTNLVWAADNYYGAPVVQTWSASVSNNKLTFTIGADGSSHDKSLGYKAVPSGTCPDPKPIPKYGEEPCINTYKYEYQWAFQPNGSSAKIDDGPNLIPTQTTFIGVSPANDSRPNSYSLSSQSGGIDVSNLSPGDHTLKVVIINEFGKSVTKSYAFTIAAAPAPTCNLTASPNKTDPGQSVKLTWTTTNNPDSCSGSVAEGDGTGWAGTSPSKTGGNKNVTPSILPTTYKLTCENDSGSGSCTARVTALAGDKQIFVNSNQSNTDFGFGGQGQIPSSCQPYNTTSGGDNSGDGAYQWSCSGPNIDLNGVDSGFNASAKSGYNITRQDCTVALSTANCVIEYTATGGGCPAGQKKGYTYCGGGGNCKASTDNSCGEDSCDNDNDCQSSGDVYVKVDGAQTSWTIDGPDNFDKAGTGTDIHYVSAPWGQYTINANPVFGMNQDFVKACRDAPAGGIDESTCVTASNRNIKNISGKKILTFWVKYSATQQQHLECQSQSCVVVQGAGSDQCSPEGSQCGGGDNAEYVSQSIPAEMCAAQQYITSVTMKNTGTTDWQNSEPGPYRLAHDSDWTWGYPRMDLPSDTVVRPGESYTFTKTVTAPGFVATFDWWWSMIRETMFGFGQQSPNTQVRTIDCGGGGCQVGQTRPYTACVGQTCASIDACGASSCASDGDCGAGPATHTECQAQSCVSVAGAGANQCASDADCGGGPGGGEGGGEGGGGMGLPGGREEECSNRIDDDVNTKVDCQESACGGTQSCGSFTGSCAMSANPEKIIKTLFGNPGSLLSWSCTGATGCGIDNGVGAVNDVGSKQVYPDTTTTYNLQCNEVGATATVFVRVYNWLLKEIRPR